MLARKVQSDGNLAVLTFNLLDFEADVKGVDHGTVAWNSTEVFRQVDGRWRIVHSHWSLVQPKLKEAT